MANKTNVVVAIENGTVSIVVLQDEACGPCMSEAVSPLENDRTYESAFCEGETFARSIEEGFGFERCRLDCLEGVVFEEFSADLFGGELEAEAGFCPSCGFAGVSHPTSPRGFRTPISCHPHRGNPFTSHLDMPLTF